MATGSEGNFELSAFIFQMNFLKFVKFFSSGCHDHRVETESCVVIEYPRMQVDVMFSFLKIFQSVAQ